MEKGLKGKEKLKSTPDLKITNQGAGIIEKPGSPSKQGESHSVKWQVLGFKWRGESGKVAFTAVNTLQHEKGELAVSSP